LKVKLNGSITQRVSASSVGKTAPMCSSTTAPSSLKATKACRKAMTLSLKSCKARKGPRQKTLCKNSNRIPPDLRNLLTAYRNPDHAPAACRVLLLAIWECLCLISGRAAESEKAFSGLKCTCHDQAGLLFQQKS